MKSLFIWLLGALLLVGVCVAGDQILLHASMDSPIFGAAQTFYQDFRGRIIQFVKKEDQRLETVKGRKPPPSPPVVVPEETIKPRLPPVTPEKKIKPLLQPLQEASGYVYTDKAGGLHLTTRLDEVPKEYRAAAKPLQK